jgi:hypothetical protein
MALAGNQKRNSERGDSRVAIRFQRHPARLSWSNFLFIMRFHVMLHARRSRGLQFNLATRDDDQDDDYD